MKRFLILLIALLLLFPAFAFADVIVEPENGFFRTHRSDCHHREGRTYLANGPDGTLPLYTAPGGTVSETLKNGASFYCQWAYTDKDGIVWGFSEQYAAWAPLGYTLVQYDHIAFEAEHKGEIITETNQTAEQLPVAYLYAYPGASNPIRMENVDLTAEKQYTDEQGRQWGFVSYIYGIRNKWFCLDDPGSDELIGEQKAPLPSGFELPAQLPAATNTGVIAGVVGGVSLTALVAVLLAFRRKKKA